MSKSKIKLRPFISENDFYVKINKCWDCLKEGYKVKVMMKFIGREIVHIKKELIL